MRGKDAVVLVDREHVGRGRAWDDVWRGTVVACLQPAGHHLP